MVPAAAARTVLSRCRRDPVFFLREVLGLEPWRKQRAVLHALRDAERVAVRSGHGTGKTFVAAGAVLWFLYCFHPAKVITTAPTQTHVRRILWAEIRRQHARARRPVGGAALEDALKLGPDAFALGLSTDEPERFQGFHAERLLVVLDEAPGVRAEVWEAAATLLTSPGAKMLAIGNPTRPAGPFYDCFRPGSGWRTIRISCLDSPNLDGDPRRPALVSRRWVEEKRAEWGADSPRFQARVLGEFPAAGEGVLLPRPALHRAAARSAPPVRRGALRLGVDVARTGADATVFCLRDDRAVRRLALWRGQDTMQTAGRVAQWIRDERLDAARVFIDDTGLGAGVTDRLRELGHAVRPVLLGAAPRDRGHYLNRRAECFWGLREALLRADGLALPAAETELLGELAELRYGLTSAGAIRLEPKAAYRARAGASPDRADALALTFDHAGEEFAPEVTVL